ncbi:Phytochrome-like protein cph1 [Rubripirellula lacrimiformis]|uniref:histidine kinase n=2 Tax=Rubripirellula lacrimiformis TaxID=1930273 RepID=A0A517NI33_9BACT|nr:Phytochrome-like protein cph1 [Rubripirellula lacrimiformis]
MNARRIFSSPKAISLLLGLLGILLSWWLAGVEARRFQSESRSNVVQQLGTVRAAVESSLNKRIYLTLGLRAFVSTHPDLNDQEFANFASALMAEGNGIRSVTLIQDNQISDIYPLQGNELAIGLNLLEMPEQRNDFLRAIETKQPWLSPPIRLVQGGEAFANRAPVYVKSDDAAENERYWGMVSILINKQELLDDIVDGLPDSLQLAIRARSSQDQSILYFYGDKSIETTEPLTLDVNLPTGNWQVMGVPTDGWQQRSPASSVIAWFGTIASIGLAALTFLLMRSNTHLRTARHTAENAADELSRKNEDLEAFVRTASHDLRAPLRHIDAFCQILAEDAADRLNENDQDCLNKIQRSSGVMSRLLASLLAFARTGCEGLAMETFDLKQMVHDVVSRLPAQDVDRVQVGNLPSIRGDRTLLPQVIQNLVENGLKYNNSEDASIQINATTSANEVTITVADNGIGMAENVIDRIFKPGVRAVSSADYSGSGFGLAICERIIKAHHGKIWVESKVGDGSTFHVSLPTV